MNNTTTALTALTAQATPCGLMTTPQAALYLGISEAWLRQMASYGGGPKLVRLGRLVRYTQKDLRDWVKTKSKSQTKTTKTTN